MYKYISNQPTEIQKNLCVPLIVIETKIKNSTVVNSKSWKAALSDG